VGTKGRSKVLVKYVGPTTGDSRENALEALIDEVEKLTKCDDYPGDDKLLVAKTVTTMRTTAILPQDSFRVRQVTAWDLKVTVALTDMVNSSATPRRMVVRMKAWRGTT
jgi:hypothetical protein